jgi:hypothetical protein
MAVLSGERFGGTLSTQQLQETKIREKNQDEDSGVVSRAVFSANPSQARIGSRGYLANRGSENESSQRMKTLPRGF